jgi:hypothetical protein
MYAHRSIEFWRALSLRFGSYPGCPSGSSGLASGCLTIAASTAASESVS